MKHWSDKLVKADACDDAVTFARKHKTFQAAWSACERGDWMLWWAGLRSGNPGSARRRKLVLAACECARLALPYTTDPRALAAIETTEAWARQSKGVTLDEVRRAADAADAASAYAYASSASAYAASAYASSASAYAASAYAYAAVARATTLRRCADIVRKHYPRPPR